MYTITYLDGKSEQAETYEEAFQVAKKYMAAWMQDGDKLYYTEHPEKGFVGFVYNEYGEHTDATCCIKTTDVTWNDLPLEASATLSNILLCEKQCDALSVTAHCEDFGLSQDAWAALQNTLVGKGVAYVQNGYIVLTEAGRRIANEIHEEYEL